MSHVSQAARLRGGIRSVAPLAGLFLGTLLLLSGRSSSEPPQSAEPPVRVPSNVTWTKETFLPELTRRMTNQRSGSRGHRAMASGLPTSWGSIPSSAR